MSTRFARTADKAQNEKNTAILKDLLKQNGNKFCADCRRKDPRWASWNIGVFVCIRCSGIHRSIGTHISKVKSVDLDSWVPEQVENMVKWGNERANLYWEANLKDMKPNENNIDMWIRSKYEGKKWAMKGPIPDPSTLGGGSTSSVAQPQVKSPKATPKEPVKTTVKPKQTEFSSLDDFFGSSPSSSTNTNTTNNNAAVIQLQGADFFSSPSSPSTNNNNSNNASKEPPKQQFDFKSSILSLYNQQPAASFTPTMNNNNNQFMGQTNNINNNGNYQQQLFGLSSSTTTPTASQPIQQSQDNVWGSFVSSSATNSNSFTSSVPLTSQPTIQGSQFFNTSSQQQQQPQQPKKQAYE
ncbi:hypothetical protein BJ944DRAFT_268837 [Cunninghamella echinulata]|nr:hypothetical protein BJ944DRAFT_268837 [Cunninghamella echinulata]